MADVAAPAGDWQDVIADPAVPGERLRELALRPDAPPEALARLAADEARLRATPGIAAAIYANPRAPLSIANLAVVTCHRAGVVPEGIPGFEELAREIIADPAALDGRLVDGAFTELLAGGGADTGAESHDLSATPAAADKTAPSPAPGVAATPAASADAGTTVAGAASAVEGQAAKGRGRRSAIIDFTRLKLYEKIRLATLGNAYCRQNLLRDSNRMVAMAVIRSPQITDGEIAKAAGNRALSEEVIRYIGNRKELVKQYPVKLALVGNAKCPLAVALRLLPTLNADDIKQFARSKNIPGALSAAAKRLTASRGPE